MDTVGTPNPAPPALYCRTCGYDLRASAEAQRCPECGRAFSPDDPLTFRPHPFAAPWKRALGRWAKRTAILLLVVGILLGGSWGWYYWGWRQERAVLAQVGGACHNRTILGGEPGRWLYGRRLPGSFVLERASLIELPATASDADLPPLRKLHRLEGLIVRGPITDAGMAHLRELPQLCLLALPNARISDAGLEPLRNLPRLGALHVKGASLTDAGLVHLEKLAGLEYLTLGQMPLTDAGLIHLEPLGKLTVLNLMRTRITDDGLVHLTRLAALREINLQGTQVTDAGLAHLTKLPALDLLFLNRTQVTHAGVSRLRAALPGCLIDWP